MQEGLFGMRDHLRKVVKSMAAKSSAVPIELYTEFTVFQKKVFFVCIIPKFFLSLTVDFIRIICFHFQVHPWLQCK